MFCLNQNNSNNIKTKFLLDKCYAYILEFIECVNNGKHFTFCFPETLQLFMVHATGKLDLSFIAGSLTKHLSCSLCLFCPFVIYQDGNFTKTDVMSKPDETTLIGQSSFVDFGKNYKDFSFACLLCFCVNVRQLSV